MGKKIYHGITFLTWNVNEKNNLSLTVNPDPKLISHRFDRLTALRFSKGRNLP